MTVNEYKIKWMKEHGFTVGYCNYRKCVIYEYKGYAWTYEEIERTSTSVIMKYKMFYDGLITEQKLEQYKKFEKTFREQDVGKMKEMLKKFIN